MNSGLTGPQLTDHLLDVALENFREGRKQPDGFVANALTEAQAEIRHLRNALREIEQPPSGEWRDLYERARLIAREALYAPEEMHGT